MTAAQEERIALGRSAALAKARRAKARADAARAREQERSARERRVWIRRESELYSATLTDETGAAKRRWLAHWRTYRWSGR